MLLSNEHWYLINISTISLITSQSDTHALKCWSHHYHHFKLILQAALLEDAGQILIRFNNRCYLKQSTLKQSIKFTLPNIYHFRCFLHVYFQQQNHKKSSCLSQFLFKYFDCENFISICWFLFQVSLRYEIAHALHQSCKSYISPCYEGGCAVKASLGSMRVSVTLWVYDVTLHSHFNKSCNLISKNVNCT